MGSGTNWVSFFLKPLYQTVANQENGAEQFILLQNNKLILYPLSYCIRNCAAVPYLELLPAKVRHGLKCFRQDGLQTSLTLWKNPDFFAEVRQTVRHMNHDFFRQFFFQERKSVQHFFCVENIR